MPSETSTLMKHLNRITLNRRRLLIMAEAYEGIELDATQQCSRRSVV